MNRLWIATITAARRPIRFSWRQVDNAGAMTDFFPEIDATRQEKCDTSDGLTLCSGCNSPYTQVGP
jgi:hypothetical protein